MAGHHLLPIHDRLVSRTTISSASIYRRGSIRPVLATSSLPKRIEQSQRFFFTLKRHGEQLEVFLETGTPHLRWRSAPMDCFGAPTDVWQLDKNDVVDYFTLEDLWEHYSESSAYGLSVPVRLEAGKTITQHFVPHLSAIQIYTTRTLAIPRSMGSEIDSWSDDSTGDKFSRSWDAASDDSSHQDFDFNPAKQSGYLSFQYSEWDPPYERASLANKVAELAEDYPCLTSLKSAELSPSSWLSVAWCPIYHIPYHGNLKGISACFLTYHSISSVFQGKDPIPAGPWHFPHSGWRRTEWKEIFGAMLDHHQTTGYTSSIGRHLRG